MAIELEVKETKRIDEGLHTGTIKKVVLRSAIKQGRQFSYIDLHIVEAKTDVELRVGYPATITKESSLGKLLQRFGVQLLTGQAVDVEAALAGQKCSFVTVNEENEAGTFARIQRESVKPAAAQ